MKNILFTTMGLLLLINTSFAQNAHFTTAGTIEYDKTANMFAIMTKLMSGMDRNQQAGYQRNLDEYKKAQAQFRTLKATLSFDTDKSLYTPSSSNPVTDIRLFTPLADNTTIVYNDLATRTTISQKSFFETPFLVKDTSLKVKWKITDETQEIAGYTCRRANGLVLDSVYVVAFYTDKIAVTGGPEGFTGLPGMILKLALPHENVVWTATKVTDTTIPPNTIVPPKKGKAVDKKGLRDALAPLMKGAGPFGPIFLKAMAL